MLHPKNNNAAAFTKYLKNLLASILIHLLLKSFSFVSPEEELKILEEEFHHHQKRLDEYDALRDELVRLESKHLV